MIVSKVVKQSRKSTAAAHLTSFVYEVDYGTLHSIGVFNDTLVVGKGPIGGGLLDAKRGDGEAGKMMAFLVQILSVRMSKPQRGTAASAVNL